MLEDVDLGTCELLRDADNLSSTLEDLGLSTRAALDLARATQRTAVLEPKTTYSSPVPRSETEPLPATERRLLGIHVCHGALSHSTCRQVMRLALEHTAAHGWETKRHLMHNTTDLPVRDSPALWSLLEPVMIGVVLPTLQVPFHPNSTPNLPLIHPSFTPHSPLIYP